MEMRVMSTKEKVRKKLTGTEAEKPEVPEDFICIDPSQQSLVYGFLKSFNNGFNNGFSHEVKEMAKIHLRLCLRCREIAAEVLKTDRYSEPKSAYYLHPEKIELPFETEALS
jgi:hypothetical protein